MLRTSSHRRPAIKAMVILLSLHCAAGAGIAAEELLDTGEITRIRTRRSELHYRVEHADSDAEIELWCRRMGVGPWQKWTTQSGVGDPLVFEAPAEGLYGLYLIVRSNGRSSSEPPKASTSPHRLVYVDYTPPLVQWDSVEPCEAFASRRIVHLAWTAHDNHLTNRPISLSYQSSIDQKWHTIEAALANSGRYDWHLPLDAAGQITLKLAVEDKGGHHVYRLYGPVRVDDWMKAGIPLTQPAATTQPAVVEQRAPASRPAGDDLFALKPPETDDDDTITEAARQRAKELWRAGSWHAERREFDAAEQRISEALQIDPDLVSARYDLGVLHYYQKDYPKATALFSQVLKREPKHVLALQGIHESYLAQREYDECYSVLKRLLELKPKDAQVWLDLGDVLYMMNDRVGARAHWLKAATVDPEARAVIEKARNQLKKYGSQKTTRSQ